MIQLLSLTFQGSNYGNHHIVHRSCARFRSLELQESVILNVNFSGHALDRYSERDGAAIPFDQIKRAGNHVEIGDEFHTSTVLHTFVSKRVSVDAVIVMTVTFNVSSKPKVTQQKRFQNHMDARRERHRVRRED